ncbi:HTH_Tnp_Tc3_2 domain-containing protein [Trichonephila clavipes]|nr:HTH_Tnp_Tc3_2 domain-containing protein [Trichonephila clavipes]
MIFVITRTKESNPAELGSFLAVSSRSLESDSSRIFIRRSPGTRFQPWHIREKDATGSGSVFGIQAHYDQPSEFERGRIIGWKEAGWANRKIARHMGLNDAAIRRIPQEWVDIDRFQRHDGGSGRPRATAYWTCNHHTSGPHTSVHPKHSQTVDRAKFTLVPTATPSATHTCTLSRAWLYKDSGDRYPCDLGVTRVITPVEICAYHSVEITWMRA